MLEASVRAAPPNISMIALLIVRPLQKDYQASVEDNILGSTSFRYAAGVQTSVDSSLMRCGMLSTKSGASRACNNSPNRDGEPSEVCLRHLGPLGIREGSNPHRSSVPHLRDVGN